LSAFQQTRGAPYEIIRRKRATYYAVATGIICIVEAILPDENTILTMSRAAQRYGISEVCLSLATKVNRNGADHILHLPLSKEAVEARLQRTPGKIGPPVVAFREIGLVRDEPHQKRTACVSITRLTRAYSRWAKVDRDRART